MPHHVFVVIRVLINLALDTRVRLLEPVELYFSDSAVFAGYLQS
jgi:hypothetical protein